MAFEFLSPTRIIFGIGVSSHLKQYASELGARPLLVVGRAAAQNSKCAQNAKSSAYENILSEFKNLPLIHCAREPIPSDIDSAAQVARENGSDVIIALGGGSVIDCGKAVAALATNDGSVSEYLEGQPTPPRQLLKKPLAIIAVPTTAGTGSEVTRNAVVTTAAAKRSLRDKNLVPKIALLDPALTITMPPSLTAACGLDALTQLIEAFLSKNSNPFTDALALDGAARAFKALPRAYVNGEDLQAREDMALASLMSGISLANAGLGAVHGFAAALGGQFEIAHGLACAALLPEVLAFNLRVAEREKNAKIIAKFTQLAARIGVPASNQTTQAIQAIQAIRDLRDSLKIPRLGALGVTEQDVPALIAGSKGSSMRYNPVVLTDDELGDILRAAL